MKKVVILLFTCAVVTALSLAEDGGRSKKMVTVSPAFAFDGTSPRHPPPVPTSPKPNTTTISPTPKTTTGSPKPKTTTIPPKPKTTTVSPTPKTTTVSPTPKTTTVSPKPKTTTISPKSNTTTVPPKNKTTTALPKSTTPPPKPPTPPAPTPATNLTSGTYNVTEKGTLCLMAQMALQIRSTIPKANGTFIVQPELTKVTGFCKDITAKLNLTFKEGNVIFTFSKNKTANVVFVDTVAFNLTYPFNLTAGALNKYNGSNKTHVFEARIGRSYSCKEESLYMGNGLYLDFTKDRMQAFNLTANKEFGGTDFCKADQQDYGVAIGVGVVLLLLIVIMIVAYLLSRRKRTQGYQTL